jgi:hypothetical protein
MSTRKQRLELLYDLLVNEMEKMLTEGKSVVAGDEVVKVSPDAATLNTVRQFLKDNNIGGADVAANPANRLIDKLPFPKDAAKEAFN